MYSIALIFLPRGLGSSGEEHGEPPRRFLCRRGVVRRAFAVINADDYYEDRAFEKILRLSSDAS